MARRKSYFAAGVLLAGLTLMVTLACLTQRSAANEILRKQMADVVVAVAKQDTEIDKLKLELAQFTLKTEVTLTRQEVQLDLNNRLLWYVIGGVALQLGNAAIRIINQARHVGGGIK